MPDLKINPSIQEIRELPKGDIVVLHPEMSIESATAFARDYPNTCPLLILPDTDLNLSCAVSAALSKNAILTLAHTISVAEGREIIRSLNPFAILYLISKMPLRTRLQLLGEMPKNGRVMIDPSTPCEEIGLTIKAIPIGQLVIISNGTPKESVIAAAKNLKRYQYVSFADKISESTLCQAVSELTEHTRLYFNWAIPLSVVSRVPPKVELVISTNIEENLAHNIAKHIPSHAITTITGLHSDNLIKAIVSGLKENVKLEMADDMPTEKILIACRALRPGTIITLGSYLNLKNSLRIARSLQHGVIVELKPNLSIEVSSNFIQERHQILQSHQISLFQQSDNQPIRHEINERELLSIYTFIDYELNENGTFYNGFNELEDDLKITLLDYLIQKNTTKEFMIDPNFESIAKALDGGYAIFNDLESSIKKVVPLADISDTMMTEIKSKIILKLELLQKKVEERIIDSFGLC